MYNIIKDESSWQFFFLDKVFWFPNNNNNNKQQPSRPHYHIKQKKKMYFISNALVVSITMLIRVGQVSEPGVAWRPWIWSITVPLKMYSYTRRSSPLLIPIVTSMWISLCFNHQLRRNELKSLGNGWERNFVSVTIAGDSSSVDFAASGLG